MSENQPCDEQIKPTILILAKSPAISTLLNERLLKYGFNIQYIQSSNDFTAATDLDTSPNFIIIEDQYYEEQNDLQEFITHCTEAFSSKDCSPQFAHLYLGQSKEASNKEFLLGFHHSFQVPFQIETLINKIFEAFPNIDIATKKLTLDAITRVSIPAIEKENELPFDVYIYLPRNNHIMKYRKKGILLDEELLTKFQKNKHQLPLYVKKSELAVYKKFYLEKFKNASKSPTLTSEERKKHLHSELTGFLSGVFQADELAPEESQSMLDVLRSTTIDFFKETSSNKDVLDRIYSLTNECSSNYNHAMNTSIYAALFASLCGHHNSEDFIIGGLLHDIGLSMIDPLIANKDPEDMTKNELEVYKLHPVYSIDIISRKKIPISSLVSKMILQHHERLDGTGYPNSETGVNIHEFSRICILADAFDKLTSVRPGKILYTPKEALKIIAGISKTPSPIDVFNHELHQGLLQLIYEGASSIPDLNDEKESLNEILDIAA